MEKRWTASGVSGFEQNAMIPLVSLLPPIHPRQSAVEVASLQWPKGTGKIITKRSLCPLAKRPGRGWSNNRKPFWQYPPYSSQMPMEKVHTLACTLMHTHAVVSVEPSKALLLHTLPSCPMKSVSSAPVPPTWWCLWSHAVT